MKKPAWLHWLAPALGLVILGFALWVLHRELSHYHWSDLVRELHAIPRGRVALSVVLTGVYYLFLSGYDALALRYVRQRVAYHRIALASFIGYAVSQGLGFPLLTGAPLRYRLYSRWGVSTLEIAKVVAFYSTTYWLGLLLVGGLAFLLEPLSAPGLRHLPLGSLRVVGIVLLAMLTVYMGLSFTHPREIGWREWRLSMPSPPLALAQVVLSSIDWIVAPSVLFVLLPPDSIGYARLVEVYLLAQIAGHASHVPGGLGVFESVVLVFLTPQVPAPQVMGILLALRAVFYLLPLLAAAVALVVYEGLKLRHRLPQVGPVAEWAAAIVPTVMAGLLFLAGGVVLVSGATPTDPLRLARLTAALPLGVVEASHLGASCAGAGLLLLARGLQLRLGRALRLSLWLLAAAAALSLLKGLDWEEAVALAAVGLALLASRGEFERRAALVRERYTLGWVVAIAVSLGATLWLAVYSVRHAGGLEEAWWSFGPDAEAGRFLRAALAAVAFTTLVALWRLLRRRARPAPVAPDAPALERVAAVVAASPHAAANLALLGDRTLLFSPGGDAFVMYAVEGRSWIALGDPVGAPEERREMAWDFRELVEEHDQWPAYYDVGTELLHVYLDMGLSLLEIGEEARVPLAGFSLDAPVLRPVRRVVRAVEAAGFSFEVIPPAAVQAVLPELEEIASAWRAAGGEERGCSIGSCDAEYLRRFPVARMRSAAGRTVAFAGVLPSGESEELLLHVLRYRPGEAPPGVLEYLPARLMEWGRGQGWRWLTFGTAPLPSMEGRDHGALWQRAGGLLFRHGEHFRRYEELRAYEQQFAPRWEPRYLASPGGLLLPRTLANVSALLRRGADRSEAA